MLQLRKESHLELPIKKAACGHNWRPLTPCKNLAYDIKWAEFPAAAPLAEALNAGAVDVGIIGDAPLLFALANGAPVKSDCRR